MAAESTEAQEASPKPDSSTPQKRSGPVAKLLKSKLLLWAIVVLPGLWPVVAWFTQDVAIIADPPRYLLNHTGTLATLFLALVLCFTPLRKLFPKQEWTRSLNRHRRLVGVACGTYGLLHLSSYWLGFGKITFEEFNTDNVFILSGAAGLFLLTLLTVTSATFMVKLLGKRWKTLHRFAYLAAFFIMWHLAIQEKTGPDRMFYAFLPVIALQVARVFKVKAQSR